VHKVLNWYQYRNRQQSWRKVFCWIISC
jgi:hypothetical protein